MSKIKKRPNLLGLFPKRNLSKAAQAFLVFIYGARQLLGKVPRIKELPEQFYAHPVMDLFIELSDEGFVLGEPTSYKLNEGKFAAQILTLKSPGNKSVRVLDVLRAFADFHAQAKRGKARTTPLALIQIRTLIRKYEGAIVVAHIPHYFNDPVIQKLKGDLSFSDYYKWAERRLGKLIDRKRRVS